MTWGPQARAAAAAARKKKGHTQTSSRKVRRAFAGRDVSKPSSMSRSNNPRTKFDANGNQSTTAFTAKQRAKGVRSGANKPVTGYVKRAAMGKLAPVRHSPLTQAANRKAGVKSSQKPVLQATKKYPSSPLSAKPQHQIPVTGHGTAAHGVSSAHAQAPKVLPPPNSVPMHFNQPRLGQPKTGKALHYANPYAGVDRAAKPAKFKKGK